MITRATIDDISCNAILDTGAGRSLISAHLALQLLESQPGRNSHTTSCEATRDIWLEAANGGRLNVLGTIACPVKLAGTVVGTIEFLISNDFKSSKSEILIGLDVLRQTFGNINVKANTVEYLGNEKSIKNGLKCKPRKPILIKLKHPFKFSICSPPPIPSVNLPISKPKLINHGYQTTNSRYGSFYNNNVSQSITKSAILNKFSQSQTK